MKKMRKIHQTVFRPDHDSKIFRKYYDAERDEIRKIIYEKYNFSYNQYERGFVKNIWMTEDEMNEFVNTMQDLEVSGSIEFNDGNLLGAMNYCPNGCTRQEALRFEVIDGRKSQHWYPIGGS